MTEPVRLAKRLAELVPCSRREAELYIEGGFVTVDGVLVEEPQHKVSEQKIVLHPDAVLTPAEPITILFHQSAGHDAADISADNRAADDASGIHALKRHFSKLSSTLPLEISASGLLVLTQDWRVTRKLVDNATTVEQEYIVEFSGELSDGALKQLGHQHTRNGRPLPPAKVSRQSENRLRFALKGVAPGQIAWLCESAGLQMVAMKRIRIGRIAMARLLPGQWRYLSPLERF